MSFELAALSVLLPLLAAGPSPTSGNRLEYLEERSPFYPGAGFPKLTTPMWIGEEGVEAVVILSIDDMRQTEPYQVFLEPILKRLVELEGRSPLSIFTCQIDPLDQQLQKWHGAGVRFDVHTRSHACPILRPPFESAVQDFLDCVENLNRIPGAQPVAFRMPCCDSINSASPRFFSEVLPLATPEGKFLEADSSVLMFLDDSYRKYAPFKGYAATAQGYPYPFVIDRRIWELPIICPSDWQAQNLQKAFNPLTVADIERGIDQVVAAKGVFTFCFHPHGWIRNTQVVEILDHVMKRHGRAVRFLNFHDVVSRLTKNLLGGVPLRAADGQDNGVRLLDVNADGFLDVVTGNDERRETRVWVPEESRWRVAPFPFEIVSRSADGVALDGRVKLGVFQANGFASALALGEGEGSLASFDGAGWRRERWSSPVPLRLGVRLHDADGDGFTDLLVSNETQNLAFRWDAAKAGLVPFPFALPSRNSIEGKPGEDRGLRLWDVNRDGFADAVLSNDDEHYVYLWDGPGRGWATRVLHGRAGSLGALPRFVSGGRDMGAWLQDNILYVANEGTAGLPSLVETRNFDRMMEHRESQPLSPEEALKRFRVPEGFRVEIFATEPLVEDPVSVSFGPDGRAWVVEMGTYPLRDGPTRSGSVKVLRDTDGDGRADTARVFADGFSFPTGALWHGRGVLVTCAPEILYLEDEDGDDRADRRVVLFDGFGEGNQQHRVNGLQYGIDNWIYGANGDSGGEIRTLAAPGAPPVRIGGRDFRFTADFRRFEAVTGHSQFGLAMDDLGNRFGTSNARHIFYSVLPEEALARNPTRTPDPVLDIPDHEPMARIYAISKELISLNDIHVPGHFSSACGITVYRGEIFPEEYRGCAYVCEPVANLVHRDVLVPEGVAFRAERGPREKESELLASSDNWFRPVFCTTGPDGALYVADMYRYVIEHPAYIPAELQQILDFSAGSDLGRIYRLVHDPAPGRKPRAHRDITRDSTRELAALLEDPNGWWRDAAQRLLVERKDPAAVPVLEALCSSAAGAVAQAQALWTLDGMGFLRDELILHAGRSPRVAVREQALRLAAPRIKRSPAILEVALACADDGAVRVRMQAALALGESDSPAAAGALAQILLRDHADRWMRAAVLSSSSAHASRLLGALFAGSDKPPVESPEWREIFEGLVSTASRHGDAKRLLESIGQAGNAGDVSRWEILICAALAEGGITGARDGELPSRWNRVMEKARTVARDDSRPEEERVEAVRALGSSLAGDVGARFFQPQTPPGTQLEVVKALARAFDGGSPEAGRTLLDAWAGSGPVVRAEMVERLLATEKGTGALLQAVEDGRILPREVDLASRKRILARGGKLFGDRAEKLFSVEPSADRERAVAAYKLALRELPRERDRGRETFRKNCAPCHRLDGIGFEVGPDLREARSRGDAELLEAILNPSGVVAPRFTPYAVETVRGIATGIIVSETAGALTLRRAGGVEESILRSDVRALSAGVESLMPSELEKVIDPQGMADLLAFLADAPRSLDSLGADEMEAARGPVISRFHNGLSKVLRWAGREAQASWVGRVEMPYVRQLDGKQALEWLTDALPADLAPGSTQSLSFPAALGYVSQPAGSFALYLDDRKLLDLDVSLDSSVWKSPDGKTTLTYSARARNAEDSTGIMTLELPASLLVPGKEARLKVVGAAANSRRWFGLLPLR